MTHVVEAQLVEADAEAWPLAQPFVISRGTKTEAHVIVARVAAAGRTGRGEAVPYARYGETVDGALQALRGLAGPLTRARLPALLPAGAARNALDCALWDLEAKLAGRRAWELAGLPAPQTVITCYTLSLGTPERMAADAKAVPHLKLLKLKLGGDGDDARMAAVRAARPDARLVADANEAWHPAQLAPFLAAAAAAGIELIEQPLPAGADQALADILRAVPVCADESAHTSAALTALAHRYDAVNIKLDKTGGLTEALQMAKAAQARGFKIMVGSMVATSLAAAPALVLACYADWIDLDGPLLLARDRDPPLAIDDGWISPPPPELWG
ncbi:MAG: dipeptide epimerase [Hyphomicrobium sp.]|uniref:N-acetyl-D-Glu racemase DgcA n=1 Tax=Hyphomicrobium sp. TaxID=82 RepID=UPI001323328D|nr:N-acetyl-D-Glu racemase DgcA [Hyphomicrobium sp.]KAB2938418.1 MAG: dipeptide epimerase [Hyphomicrobium sp.]MBZ0211513.1 dipeptide epimerase [Hyphomicrobium sp.]